MILKEPAMAFTKLVTIILCPFLPLALAYLTFE
jgi:hypothetical protein